MAYPIYLDSNATTPIAPEVQQVIVDALESSWGNVSSNSLYGRQAKECVENARRQVALMINAKPDEVVFTSGGTEANNMILNTFTSYCKDFQDKVSEIGDAIAPQSFVPHIITSSIEHDSVRKPLEHSLAQGLVQVTFVDVDPVSRAVKAESIINAIQSNTVLVSVMLANNETGEYGYLSLIRHCLSVSDVVMYLFNVATEKLRIWRKTVFFSKCVVHLFLWPASESHWHLH